MTDQEINLAIAEWMGKCSARKGFNEDNECCICGWKACADRHQLPDFRHDLNAMHEAEERLTFNQSGAYEGYLDAIKDRPFLIDGSCPHAIWHLEAKDKAEALLRAIGKWKD